MAQIIKHRRGSLESISGATKRAGELLVVTGSSGITAANGNSILFVGIDGSTVTPANKVLQGTTVPNLTGASYDTSIDGIPFYDTTAEKLYILNKGGNVEIKASANTGGTGIVSGSTQVKDLLPAGTVSGSIQVIDILSSLNTFSASEESKNSTLAEYTASVNDRLDQLSTDSGSQASRLLSIEGFTSSIDTTIKTKLDADGVISSSAQVQINDVTGFSSFSSSVATDFSASNADLTALSASVSSVTGEFSASVATTFANVEASQSAQNDRLDQLETDSGSQAGRLNNLESFSSSVETAISLDGANVTILGNFTVAGTQTIVDSTTVQIGDNIIELNGSGATNGGLYVKDATAPNTATGSLLWDSTNDYWVAGTKDNESKVLVAGGDGVISGSSQVQIDDVTGFTSFSSSVDSRVDALEEAIGNGSNIDVRLTNLELTSASHDGRLDNLESFSASAELDLTELFATASDHESRVDALEAFSSSLDAGFVTEAELAAATGALETADTAQQARLTSLEGFTSSIDTTIKTKLDADGVVSSSAQIVTLLENQATDFGTGRVSADNIGNVDGTSTITGSFVGDGSGLTGLVTTLELTGSDGVASTVDLLTQGLTFTSASAQGLGITVSGQTVTFSNVNASTSVKGVASFDADDFSVSSGNVSIKDGGVRAVNLNSDVAGTGLSLDGVDNSLEVDYGSTAGTAVEGDTNLTVQGTANEIEISNGSVTLGSGGTITIGLPDDVTIATASIQNNLTVGNDLTVVGNLFVQGTTTTIDSTTVQIGDNIIELNAGGASANAGLLVTDVTAPNTNSGSLLWNATADYWMGGALGSEKEFARFNSTPTSGSVQVIGANGLLVDAPITTDGTDVSITGDLTIGGLTANSFLVANGTKELTSVAAVNTGDLIQWNGSSFVASNTIDGGTF
jgi:hypothetical protein